MLAFSKYEHFMCLAQITNLWTIHVHVCILYIHKYNKLHVHFKNLNKSLWYMVIPTVPDGLVPLQSHEYTQRQFIRWY